MAFSASTQGKASTNINVTPLIDVLLVLLIIFMILTPLKPTGLETQTPQSQSEDNPRKDLDVAIVIEVLHHQSVDPPKLKINKTDVGWDKLGSTLSEVFKLRSDKTAFVKGDSEVDFHYVAQVIDIAHTSGAERIGLMTK